MVPNSIAEAGRGRGCSDATSGGRQGYDERSPPATGAGIGDLLKMIAAAVQKRSNVCDNWRRVSEIVGVS